MGPTIQSTYLNSIFGHGRYLKTIEASLQVARFIQKKYPYDTIVFCGISGSAIAFPLSFCLNVPLLCVRKRNDDSHHVKSSESCLEGNIDLKRYLLVDDMISTGATVEYIIHSISTDDTLHKAKCVAMLLYTHGNDGSYKHNPERGYSNWKYGAIPYFSSNPEYLESSKDIIGAGV